MTSTTVAARPLQPSDEAGYAELLDTLFPGKGLGVGFGPQLGATVSGKASTVVSEDENGVLTGFIQAEPHISGAGADGTTAHIESFITRPGTGAFGYLVEGLLGDVHGTFNQVVIAIPEDQVQAFTDLGWLVLDQGHGLAWGHGGSNVVRFLEARRPGTTRVAMRLLNHGLHVWSYPQASKADNQRGRHARVQKALTAAQKTQDGFAQGLKSIRVA